VTRPRVYLAHPVSTYGTRWATRCVRAVEQAWADAEVIDPATWFASNEEWLASWPSIVKTLAALVVVGDELGRIGVGCWREMGDAIFWEVPVFTLAEGRCGGLDVARVARLEVPVHPTPSSAAMVRPGALVRPPARSAAGGPGAGR
jgi:hypothetical protein